MAYQGCKAAATDNNILIFLQGGFFLILNNPLEAIFAVLISHLVVSARAVPADGPDGENLPQFRTGSS